MLLKGWETGEDTAPRLMLLARRYQDAVAPVSDEVKKKGTVY